MTLIVLFLLGIITGILSGIFGVGGGFILVPALTFLGVSVVNAAATSLVGILFTAMSGSLGNWWIGQLNWRPCFQIALVGIPAAQVGAWLADRLSDRWLALSFALLLLLTIYLIYWRQTLRTASDNPQDETDCNAILSVPLIGWKFAQIGAISGVMSGLFGIGGGIVMVPLQMLLLGESIKLAAPTSLGAMVAIAASGLVQHTWHHHVLWISGICLGIGGIIGAQIGTVFLNKIPVHWINRVFNLLLIGLALYMLKKSWAIGLV